MAISATVKPFYTVNMKCKLRVKQLWISQILYTVAQFAQFSEQIMSANKYPSIFSRQMEAIVYLVELIY